MQQVKHFKNTHDSIYASISVNTDTRLLLSMWCGELQQEGQVSEVLKYCCEQVIRYSLKSWVSDVTSVDGQYQSLSAEVQKILLAELGNTHLEYFALVSPRSANPVRSAVVHAIRQHGIEVRTFEGFAAAMEWLVLPSNDRAVWKQAVLAEHVTRCAE
jgi:hypothetical protein